jgi:formylmethanofuran dehydrogenase subunit E
MGTVAKRILASSGNKGNLSRVIVKVPLRTPYSCILDGIQITTKCTIGNQRLKVEDSLEEITAEFQARDANKTLILSTNPRIIGEIENAFSRGTTNEELAERIASASEDQLFELKRR